MHHPVNFNIIFTFVLYRTTLLCIVTILYYPHQSAYKSGHCTVTALLSIKTGVQLSLTGGESSALVLLDLPAAFDIIDLDYLLGSRKSSFGLGGTVLKLFVCLLPE